MKIPIPTEQEIRDFLDDMEAAEARRQTPFGKLSAVMSALGNEIAKSMGLPKVLDFLSRLLSR